MMAVERGENWVVTKVAEYIAEYECVSGCIFGKTGIPGPAPPSGIADKKEASVWQDRDQWNCLEDPA